MRRLLAAVLITGAVLAGVVLPASATPATTLTGPARVGYGGTVTLTGHTATPKSAVTVYFHRAGSSGYTARRQLTSNSAGTFSTTYVADADYRYYAVSGATRSAPGLTTLPKLICTTSGSAFSLTPLITSEPEAGYPGPFAGLQQTNGAGLWAGYAVDNNTLTVFTWSSASHHISVLDRLTYLEVPYNYDSDGSVRVVAVTRHGSVVAAVQSTRSGTDDINFTGRVYSDGHRYALKSAANWASVRPVGISNSGTIVGEVRVGPDNSHGQYYVVTWANATAPYRVVARTGSYPQVDGNGDISYVDSHSITTIRRPSGALVATLPLGEYTDHADGSASFYGSDDATFGIRRTTVTTAGLQRLLVMPRQTDPFVTDVSSRGAVISGGSGRQVLRTAEGGLTVLPLQLMHKFNEQTPTAVSPSGTVAYTAPDRLVHFFSCTSH